MSKGMNTKFQVSQTPGWRCVGQFDEAHGRLDRTGMKLTAAARRRLALQRHIDVLGWRAQPAMSFSRTGYTRAAKRPTFTNFDP